MVSVNRARDEAYAFCYSENKVRLYQWSFLKKNASQGFTMGQVSEMVHRTSRMIEYYMERGLMKPPQMTYSLLSGKPGIRIFSEEDVYKVREIVSSMHIGRPRNDGKIVPGPTSSKEELYAKMKYDVTLYAKNSDGEFVPLYLAGDW